MSDIEQMLSNHQADSWADTVDASSYVFDDDAKPPLARLESYVDYCFDTYHIVYETLDREQIQTCVADWGKRRGQCRWNKRMTERQFGKRVPRSKQRASPGEHVVFVATALVGVGPGDDKGVGWKPCVRHELGHAIDYERRGESGHGPLFKNVMAQFGEGANDGQHAHGYPPRVHR